MERRVNEWLSIEFEREQERPGPIPINSLTLYVEEWGSDAGSVWYREPGQAPVLWPLHRLRRVRAFTTEPGDDGPQFVDPTRRIPRA